MVQNKIIKTMEDINADDNDTIIGRLSADTIKYFERVEQVLEDNVFEDEEHKETFLRNVFVQIETDGTHLARHSNKTSRIIEKIIPCLNDEFYEKMIQLIQTEIEMLSCDRFSSHVIETLCKNINLHLENNNVAESFVSFCKKLRKTCSVLLRDTYGSHVLSTVLQVLSGVKVPEIITKSRALRQSKKKIKKPKGAPDDITEPVVTEVPRIFKKCFKKYVKVIQDDINFGELLCHRTASPVLQVLLIATSKVSETNYNTLYTAIVSRGRIFQIEGGAEEDEEFVCRLPVVFIDEVGSHLFEAIIKTAGEVYLEELGEKCFKNCILSLCVHPLANYLAQTFLRSVKSAEHAEFFISRLIKYTEDILAKGNMGCIVRLAELINKFKIVEYQKKFIMALSTALHIPENCNEKPLSKLVLCMMTYELLYNTCRKENITEEKMSDTEDKECDDESKEIDGKICKQIIQKNYINYHGCCLLQNLFLFKKSKIVVESFVELTIDEMKIIACHPNGSFTFESFFKSQWIPLKSKIYIGEILLDCTDQMACDKWGSRVIDCIFKGVDDAMQERIRYILREHKIKLESDLYGRIVLYNCGVKQHVVTMREVREQQQEKRKKLFENIIAENGIETQIPPVTKKKKIDDRAAKYREQLLSLGISFDNNMENLKEDGEKIKVEAVDESKNDVQDNLSDVIQAIEDSVKHKPKKIKLT